jgi:TonB-dependent SusC/RagA subfamily outer membrane receptor
MYKLEDKTPLREILNPCVVDGIPISSQELDNGNNTTVLTNNLELLILTNSIESVTILKGASASALWGFRAANGVILITTKKR